MEFSYLATSVGLLIFSYLCGSVMSAMVVIRILHLRTAREAGSGNPGATNMLRLHGKAAGALTLAGDAAKGVVPVLLAKALAMAEPVVMLCALAVFCGHLFPLFRKFKGGKGVATLLGVLWAIHWHLGATFSISWLLLAALWRYSSLASMGAAMATLVTSLTMMPQSLYAVAPATLLLLWKHRGNLYRLAAGKENHIGS